MSAQFGDTALKELQERLRSLPDPVAMLQEIVACAPVGLQIYAASGHCVLVNPRHTEMFGGVPPPDYNVFEDTLLIKHGVADLVRRAFAGERTVIPPIWYNIRDLQNIKADGGRRFAVGAELVPLRSGAGGAVSHVLFVFQDVTELLQAREAAERAAQEAQQARDVAETAAAQAAFLADAGRVLSASLDHEATLRRIARLATPTLADFCIVDLLGDDGAMRRVAASHADPAGQPILDELCRRYPPHADSPQPAMRVIRSREPELLVEVDPEVVARHTVSAEHRDLMLRLGVRSHISVPLMLGQRILGAISLGYVGARRYGRADIPLIEALASRAAGAIDNARLYRDAEWARAEAENASRAKDGFLALLGHELRNPLSPIVTALQLMRMRDIGGVHRREQEVIQRQVNHMVRLVDDLLDVSRITRGQIELKSEVVRLADVLTKAVEMASLLVEQRRHRLHVDIDMELHWEGDPVRLAQAVANLLTNAARYTERDGDIWLQAQQERDGRIRISVRDSGNGIPAELLPRIFEPFFQGARGVDRAEGGLGIGLTLVKSLVEMHGGTVHASSAGPGLGSEFVIHLAQHAELSRPAPLPGLDMGTVTVTCVKRRVLIVDDNADGAEMLGRLMRASGHDVAVFYDPIAALNAVPVFAPEVALLDIGLPVIDGYELALRIRALLAGKPCRLIALSGYGQEADKIRSHEVGFDLHLVKPLDPAKALALLG